MTSPRLSVLGAILVLGCASAGTTTNTAESSGPSSDRVLVATLTPQNYSGGQVSGRARILPGERAGQYRAEIDLRGAGYQNQLPWVIRRGRCGEIGQDIGSPMAYRQVTTSADGSAQLRTTVNVSLPDGETMHVAILRSPTQRDQVIACGVLSYES